MPQANQLYVRRDDVNVSAKDLLDISGLNGAVSGRGGGKGGVG
jgi:hypothetical protein